MWQPTTQHTWVSLVITVLLSASQPVLSDESQCHADCSGIPTVTLQAADPVNWTVEYTQRLVGPTLPGFNVSYPFARAPFPLASPAFCKLGCTYFFAAFSTDVTCKGQCDITYFQNTTVGYSDWAEKARLECQDGCDIALLRCQPGYYCASGAMVQCPAGTYRNTDFSEVQSCVPCPKGTFRELGKGRAVDDCELCPINTYQNTTGSSSQYDCIRCPDGYYGQEEGMAECLCITGQSCLPAWQNFQRESEPFVGRW